MAKLCPQCEKENPTVANVCMFCGASFVENAETNPADQLNKELREAKKDLQLYRKSLEEANAKIEELKNSIISVRNNAAKELAVKEKQNVILTQQFNAEKKRKAGWAWFFFLLCVILSLVFVAVIGNVFTRMANDTELKAENDRLLKQNSQYSSYRATAKTYFYDFVNGQFNRQSYYLETNDVVNINMQISGYGYTEFVNRDGKKIKGWLKMSELTKI